MFVSVPDIISKTGLTYEISKEHWMVVSITKTGVRKVLKPDNGRVKLAGERYMIYDVAKLAGLEPKSWPEDEREYEELKITSDGFGYRYRTFKNAQVQKMDQHGVVSYQEHTKNTEGYYKVVIAGENVLVHQMMGETRFVPKPDNMPSNWTIHHKNNDKSNNHCDNLEWASPKKQVKEQRSMEQHSIQSCPVIGTALRDVTLVDGTMMKKGDEKFFDNIKKAADAVGGNQGHISSCISKNGKRKFNANFTWRTPPNDEDFVGEVFKSIGSGKQMKRFVSTFGRMKQAFHNGYVKILFAKELLTDRQHREQDKYPSIGIKGNKMFHHVVVELFFGTIPKTVVINGKTHRLVVDHIDDDKQNARLDNLQLVTQQENTKKRFLGEYTTSVASAVWNDHKRRHEYECSHKTRINAVEYVRSRGYPEATLDELNSYVNTPNKIYGRTWIRAHFETTD
ncbi:hypothetical protein FK949_gp045 [Paramecium bursaria Chlorella virus NYs1]|uniref:HNH nuclease domain-containing protein n=1 Tax=Paramecium bursaria Chlorella virus NYs1 TaxID=83442 RepID=M1IJG5_9PHYC|nr:hypothetical protein FK949_gp045 [Paramecium bursaria Chlorella virus NYs1]AGE54945.1 hypothetical protein PBCVMA1D_497L [Paramecium bursaria Chlorella virus MA1D]AGE58610.1 hypothetical protein PBCVNYs1_126R [Paramecium bursaria Chlorella virus NYs1]